MLIEIRFNENGSARAGQIACVKPTAENLEIWKKQILV